MMFQHGRQLDWPFDPLEALRRWPMDRQVLLLHSGRAHPLWARYSILASPQATYRFTASRNGQGQSHWLSDELPCPIRDFQHKPFSDLRALIHAGEGLWIGCLSYDLGRWVERLPATALDDRADPIIELGYCPGFLVHDNHRGIWSALGHWVKGGEPNLASASPHQEAYIADPPVSVFDRAVYQAAVRKVLDYIAAGDVFQVNLAQRFTAGFHGRYPSAQRTCYQHLATVSPAWYGAYLELDRHGGQRVIASTSPELFLRVDEPGRVVTRPIKGTRPADVSAEELRQSEKDKAELNMIVDLMRNDLGRVCAYGSVRVPQPRVIEAHPTVHHGVATITGRLHQSKDFVDLLRATMPGGSVTGAPKIRAMQIIEELEPVRRGPYCGCIGYLSRTGCCLNIAIRTMLHDVAEQRVDFSVGGGIVADSDPCSEYQETLDKAAAMMAALRQAAPPPLLTPANVKGRG